MRKQASEAADAVIESMTELLNMVVKKKVRQAFEELDAGLSEYKKSAGPRISAKQWRLWRRSVSQIVKDTSGPDLTEKQLQNINSIAQRLRNTFDHYAEATPEPDQD